MRNKALFFCDYKNNEQRTALFYHILGESNRPEAEEKRNEFNKKITREPWD